ncbi:MAG: MazG nucleotide pyrophosphohydrolase domain-containing protein [Candidatus Altiarchaeota archaeon]
MTDAGGKFAELVELMDYMRGPSGCAWDKEQTIESFLKHLGNESDEVLDAIKNGDNDNLCEELGDLLWNIVFLAQIAKEKDLFEISDVLDGVKEKIIRRHPHVFGDKKITNPDEIVRQWHEIKKYEKK